MNVRSGYYIHAKSLLAITFYINFATAFKSDENEKNNLYH